MILLTVAEHFHIKTDDIKGSKRSADIVIPRQIAMYLCKNMTDASLEAIGKVLGGRDHSTVVHGIKKVAEDVSADEAVAKTVETIKKKINPN